ncbi:hypothetical protein Tco_0820161 [Tanacetum coccineum]|uniref:Uncharacterized protein n=1 Tax=Tanacetum coccineum TaxID=301880 RepID=A0ABQ5ABN8_9ASTR
MLSPQRLKFRRKTSFKGRHMILGRSSNGSADELERRSSAKAGGGGLGVGNHSTTILLQQGSGLSADRKAQPLQDRQDQSSQAVNMWMRNLATINSRRLFVYDRPLSQEQLAWMTRSGQRMTSVRSKDFITAYRERTKIRRSSSLERFVGGRVRILTTSCSTEQRDDIVSTIKSALIEFSRVLWERKNCTKRSDHAVYLIGVIRLVRFRYYPDDPAKRRILPRDNPLVSVDVLRNRVNSYAARITKMIADIEDRHHRPKHPSETIVFHNEDGNPARANIKQALGYRKDGRWRWKFPVPEMSNIVFGYWANGKEPPGTSNDIVGVKKELDQLDDLANGNSSLFKDAKWKV